MGVALDSWEFWAPMGAMAAGILALIALLFTWSVAIVSPPSANRAVPVRLVLLGIWLITGAVIWGCGVHYQAHAPVEVWMVVMVGLFGLQIIIAINERERWAPRVARTIPGRTLLALPAFLLYSGAAGGLTLGILMIGLSLAAGYCWPIFYPTWRDEKELANAVDVMLLISLYVLSYCLTAVLVRRFLFPNQVKPVFTWVVALVLVAAGSMVPYLIGFMIYFNHLRDMREQYWLLTSPFWAPYDKLHRSNYETFAAIWAGVVVLLNLPWYVRQVQAFQPYRKNPKGRGDHE
jgi:hypothetical protein